MLYGVLVAEGGKGADMVVVGGSSLAPRVQVVGRRVKCGGGALSQPQDSFVR